MPQFKNIHFVINPAAGQPEPILNVINKVLHPHDIDWDISITHEDGDGKRYTQEAVENGADLIVSYGGDGTVKDVLNGLLQTDVPMALLHGGTGNAMAYELGIPPSLEEAVALIIGDHEVRGVDVGQVVCHDAPDNVGYFMLRMSMGLQTKILETASRELKEQYGNLAYVLASVKELSASENVTYRLTIDGDDIEGTGITALIANSAYVGGQANFKLISTVDPADGLLDVLVMDNSFANTINMIGSALQLEGADITQHWQGKEITIHEPAGQGITLDGETFGQTPVDVKIIANAVNVIVPPAKTEEGTDN